MHLLILKIVTWNFEFISFENYISYGQPIALVIIQDLFMLIAKYVSISSCKESPGANSYQCMVHGLNIYLFIYYCLGMTALLHYNIVHCYWNIEKF